MSIGNSIRRLLIVATVIVAFCIAGGSVYAADQVKVHMINVGNADSFLVEYNGHYALIDGGEEVGGWGGSTSVSTSTLKLTRWHIITRTTLNPLGERVICTLKWGIDCRVKHYDRD